MFTCPCCNVSMVIVEGQFQVFLFSSLHSNITGCTIELRYDFSEESYGVRNIHGVKAQTAKEALAYFENCATIGEAQIMFDRLFPIRRCKP